MKTIPKLLITLIVLLLLFSHFSVFAESTDKLETVASEMPPDAQNQLPQFSAEIVTDGETPGIYATLRYIPENTMDISLMYSFGGEQFESFSGFLWDLNQPPESPTLLTQLCMKTDEYPFTAYERELVNSLYLKLYITREGEDIQTETVKFSHNNSYLLPETPPAFTAKIQLDSQGYHEIVGKFTELPPNVARVRPMYSLNGQDYQPINEEYFNDWYLNSMGTENVQEQFFLENQVCALSYHEPLKSYRAMKLDHFYIRLQITTEIGETYHTQATFIARGEPQPLPENTTAYATFPFTMRVPEEYEQPTYPYGQYQITAKENATAEEIGKLLPDMLPIEVQILQKDSDELLTWGRVNCKVMWKALPPLSLTAGEAMTIPDAIHSIAIPAGAEVATPLGTYILPTPLSFSKPGINDKVQLVIDAVPKDGKPEVSLRENDFFNTRGDYGALSLAFHQKPSGATSIKAYSFVNEDENWEEICDLLNYRDLNHNQSASLYGFVNLLHPNESPLSDYLRGEIPGFFIGLKIEGGTFDGEQVILPWPGDYNPPKEIFEPDSSEGNRGDVGSGGDEQDNAGNSGHRPNLPDQIPDENNNTDSDAMVIQPPENTDSNATVTQPTKPLEKDVPLTSMPVKSSDLPPQKDQLNGSNKQPALIPESQTVLAPPPEEKQSPERSNSTPTGKTGTLLAILVGLTIATIAFTTTGTFAGFRAKINDTLKQWFRR